MLRDMRSSRTHGRAVWAASVAALVCVACENPVDTTPNRFDAASPTPLDGAARVPDGPLSDATDESGACGCLEVGQTFRFDSLTLESLDGGPHPAVGQLNDKWGHDIRARLLNVLFEVTEVAEDRVRVHALNAARDLVPSAQASAPICRLEPTSVDFELERTGCAFTMTAPAGIRIYVGTTAETKNCAPTLPVPNAIPIDRVRLAFTLRPDCAALDDGRVLEASLPKAALDRVCTCLADDVGACAGAAAQPGCDGCAGSYFNLSGLLLALGRGVAPAYRCTDANGGPALCLEARFSSERVRDPLPDCPPGVP